ncbi:MAG: tRNA pseudouridine(55) synthase TruB [Acidimicrobiales bacterium]
MTATKPDGLVVVDKAAGWTSHDVVAKLRGVLGTRKIGHAGTLDPDATGVLLVGVGRVTRLLQFLSGLDKSYVGEVVLGAETSTLDAGGEVTATHDMCGVSVDDVRAATARFVGEIEQIPPMVSAVKIGGRRLHELARQGIEVERAARPVSIRQLDVEPTDDPQVYRITVTCSSGTYVRTLAADLGHALGGGAHLRALRRTGVGAFTVEDAVALEAVTVDGLLPAADALPHLEVVRVGVDVAAAVGHGKVLPVATLGAAGDGPWRVLGPDGDLLAVYQHHRAGTVKPAVVLAAS